MLEEIINLLVGREWTRQSNIDSQFGNVVVRCQSSFSLSKGDCVVTVFIQHEAERVNWIGFQKVPERPLKSEELASGYGGEGAKMHTSLIISRNHNRVSVETSNAERKIELLFSGSLPMRLS